MSSTDISEGPADNASASKTPAQLMQEQHEAAENHKVTIEDAVDEDDVQQPGPPPAAAILEEATSSAPAPTNGMMSAKVAGKQKASEMMGGIDTHDEEAFPSLGSGPKPAVPRATGWSAAAVRSPMAKTSSSRPTSGVQTPASAPGTRTPTTGATSNKVLLPGRSQDSFSIVNADLDKSKPRQKIFTEVKKKFNVIVTERVTGDKTTFTAEGPTNQVTPALMFISKELTVEKLKKIEIPASATAQIIGAKGANIKKLQEKHGVSINVRQGTGNGPAKDSSGSANTVVKDSSAESNGLVTVEVKGHAAAVAQASSEIALIAKQHEKAIKLQLQNIPPEFFPFIAGRNQKSIKKFEDENNVQIDVPAYHSWRSQAPAKVESDGQAGRFMPHGDSHITVSGNTAEVQQARAYIEAIAEKLQGELELEELQAQQFLHPFIVGNRGIDPIEFLRKTDCMVITPPGHHDTEEIHIIGPAARLADGRNYAEELMAMRHNQQVHLQKQFADAPNTERHSRALAQYLQRKAIEREFSENHGAEIIFPNNLQSTSWTVITDDARKAMSARNELSKITQAYPTARIHLVEVDPFFHPHIEGMHGKTMQNDMGVHLIVPGNAEPVILVYEGPQSESPFQIPRTKPTKAEITEFQKVLYEAQERLLSSISHTGISSRDIQVPPRYHDRVRRYVKQEQQPSAGFPVQVDFERGKQNKVSLRHPEDAALEELQRKIEQFLVEAEQDEKERGHTISAPFQTKLKSLLIGKKGKFVQSLREKYDVDIQVGDDKTDEIKIIGPPKKAEACKAEITKLHKAWADEVSYVIKVDPKFHGQLVGRNGENLKRIQARADDLVRVDFPRQARASDDASEIASEAGGRKRASAPDEVTIRGPKAKADQVREELLSLKQFIEDKSHSATVSVAQDQVASLIGRAGSELNKLRTDTGAEIDIPQANGSERVTITIRGTKTGVDKARAEITKRAKVFDSIVTKNIDVDSKYHRALIGGQGANIQSLVSKAGGTGQSAEHVRFPRQGEQSNTLTVKGTQDVVDAIVKEIEDFVTKRDNQVVEVVDVPLRLHRNLIGQGGANRAEFEKKHGVQMNVPRQNENKTGVRLTGPAESVAAAKEQLTQLVDSQKGETISIPRKHHHAVAQNGATFTELRQMGFRVDHGGARVPARPKTSGATNSASGALPLITDQAEDAAQAAPLWEIVSLTAENEEGDIVWSLSPVRHDSPPSAEDTARAKARIQALLEAAGTPRFTGYLTLPDPKLHRRVIGQKGETIDGMRKATGCDIQVPKRDARSGGAPGGDAITITGSEEGVLKAKELILEAVSN